MITLSEKIQDTLHVIAGILWIFLGVAFYFAKTSPPALMYAAFIAVVIICLIYFILGASKGEENRIAIGVPLFYPILCWAGCWIIGFTVAYSTRGKAMGLIFGMHPGWFSALLFYWIGTFLTSTLGFYLFFKKWYLPDEEWKKFLDEAAKYKTLE